MIRTDLVDRHSQLKSPLVEACVTSAGQATLCEVAAAERLELCRRLSVGGLTPSQALIESVRKVASVPIMVLARVRADTFRLSSAEVHELTREVAALAELEVDGIVVGPLDRSGQIDVAALEDVVSAAGRLPVTFHRAFDELADPLSGLETLASAGVARVLTSGGASIAWEGRHTLRALVDAAPDGLVIVGGGGIRADHARRLVDETGLREIHARAAAIPELIEALADPPMLRPPH